MQLIYARTTIDSDHDKVKKLAIGYSDDVSVFLNGKILYRGRSAQSFRDPEFLGVVTAVFASDRDGNSNIYTMRSDGSEVRRLTSAPRRNAHPSFSRDGRKIVFQSPRANGRDTNLYSMNADVTGMLQLTRLVGFVGVPQVSLDNKRIAFQWRASGALDNNDKWHLAVIDASGNNFRLIAPADANDQVPSWAVDGTHLLFSSDRSQKNQLYTMDDVVRMLV